MNWKIAAADVREWHNEGLYHALLCDPPYEYGFMGKSWDASGVAFQPETWAHLGEFLHPGAFGMAFAGARMYHRIACAIEDAGFILHPMIGWVYGSGFPKATRIDTQIDKAAGAEREVVRTVRKLASAAKCHEGWERPWAYDDNGEPKRTMNIEAPATPLAATWAGHRYGLQAMKPALEPIVVFQKPYRGKAVDSITATGAGALWVDGGRIGTEQTERGREGRNTDGGYGRGYGANVAPPASGRWPANFALCHLPECGDACADGCPVKALGEQGGESVSKRADRGKGIDGATFRNPNGALHGERGHDDSGTSARFFFNAAWELERTDPFFYCAKAGRKERDAGLEGMPLQCAGAYGDFAGDGRGRQTEHTPARNPHPTVKPLALTRWLATLLLPPKEYAPRRILVPFSGSGSEMIGAALAGWDFAQGIEQSQEYVEIAEARLRHWTMQPVLEGMN